MAQSGLTLANRWTVVHQAPLSSGFPRKEYWSGLPFYSPGNLPHPGIEPPVLADRFFTAEPARKPISKRLEKAYVDLEYGGVFIHLGDEAATQPAQPNFQPLIRKLDILCFIFGEGEGITRGVGGSAWPAVQGFKQ